MPPAWRRRWRSSSRSFQSQPWRKSSVPHPRDFLLSRGWETTGLAPSVLLAISAFLRSQVELDRREAQLLCLGIVVEEQGLALEPVDADGHQQHVSGHAGRDDFVAADSAVLVLVAVGTPVLLKAIE